MKIFLFTLFCLLVLTPLIFAEQTPLFIQNKTPKVELAQDLATELMDLVLENGEFTLVEDRMDRSIQVLIQATNAYVDLYAVSVIYAVNSGTCIWYYNSSLFMTSPKQSAYEPANLYASLMRQLPQMKHLMD